jgi:cysteine desulfurase
MLPFLTAEFGNPASLHQEGLRAREAREQARGQAAAFLGAGSADQVVFTSGGAEAINLVVKGVALASRSRGNHLVVSAVEHVNVLNAAAFLESQGFACTRVAVDASGRVDPEAVRAALTPQTILAAIQHANHEVGTVQPVAEIAQVTAALGVPLLVDATASGGWLPTRVAELGADFLVVSPHRFYGPKGVGILYRTRRARMASLLHGGPQEGGRRAGTENVAAIVGAGVACELAGREFARRQAHVGQLQQQLWEGLRAPGLVLNGPRPGPQRLYTNLNLSVPGLEGEALVLRCDLKGLALASGSSCLSKAVKISHVLQAIGLDHARAQGSVLFSPGMDNTEEDIRWAVDTFSAAARFLREMSPA